MRTLLPCIAILLGCSGARPAPEPEPLVVWIGPDEALDETAAEALRATSSLAEDDDCAFLWGDVRARPATARPARFAWRGGEEALSGVVLCGAHVDAAMPRPHRRVVLYWRDGQLLASDAEGHVAKPSGLLEDDESTAPAVAVFEADTSDPDAPAESVLRELATASDAYAVALWPIR